MELLSKMKRRDLELLDWRRKRLKEGNLNLRWNWLDQELVVPELAIYGGRDGGNVIGELFYREVKCGS